MSHWGDWGELRDLGLLYDCELKDLQDLKRICDRGERGDRGGECLGNQVKILSEKNHDLENQLSILRGKLYQETDRQRKQLESLVRKLERIQHSPLQISRTVPPKQTRGVKLLGKRENGRLKFEFEPDPLEISLAKIYSRRRDNARGTNDESIESIESIESD